MSNSGFSTFSNAAQAIDSLVRRVPDFPSPGILFEDLTPVLANGDAFRIICGELAQACRDYGAELIAGLDARGFLLGSGVAYSLGLGILAVRKKGKLPPPVISRDYDLEYGQAALEIPAEGVDLKGKKVVLIDDVLATGGTLFAARELLEEAGAIVTGLGVVLEVAGLNGRDKLADLPLTVVGSAPAYLPSATGADTEGQNGE